MSVVAFGLWRIVNRPYDQKELKTTKKVSVIIAARDESSNIINCLKALTQQHFDEDSYEIIVVNDHSTDATPELVKDYASNSDVSIKLFNLMHAQTKKQALRLGIENSSYDIIATTDADCIVPKNWVKNIALAFENNTAMALGPVSFEHSKSGLGIFQVMDLLALQAVEFGLLHLKQPILNNGANLAFTKAGFEKVNGFDDKTTPSGDDIFLLERFNKKFKGKIRAMLKKESIVHTQPVLSLKEFINQRVRWSSKSKYYSNPMLIYFTYLIAIENIMQLFIYPLVLLDEKNKCFYAIMILVKWVIDFILLFLASVFFERRKYLVYFIPIQLVYPLYIIVVGFASMFLKFEWKGRRY